MIWNSCLVNKGLLSGAWAFGSLDPAFVLCPSAAIQDPLSHGVCFFRALRSSVKAGMGDPSLGGEGEGGKAPQDRVGSPR